MTKSKVKEEVSRFGVKFSPTDHPNEVLVSCGEESFVLPNFQQYRYTKLSILKEEAKRFAIMKDNL